MKTGEWDAKSKLVTFWDEERRKAWHNLDYDPSHRLWLQYNGMGELRILSSKPVSHSSRDGIVWTGTSMEDAVNKLEELKQISRP